MQIDTVYDPLSQKARERAFERAFQAKSGTAEFASIRSYANRRKRQRALALWLFDKEFDLFITLNSNDPFLNYEQGRAALKKLGALLDHYFLGRKWWNYESNRRTYFVAIPEHGGGELHYHVLVRIPTNALRDCRDLYSGPRNSDQAIS